MKNIRYINAGAGSGKTHTLSHILSDSLLGVKGRPKVDSSEVILTTFTKAAAAEFREKSRAALIEAGFPDVAAELEGAAIGTVHSVCEQFVHKYWFILGLSPQAKVISDEDKEFYTNQSIAKNAGVADIQAFNEFCRTFDVIKYENGLPKEDFEFWKDYVKAVIDRMTTYAITNLTESIRQSKAEIDSVFSSAAVPSALDIEGFLAIMEKVFRDRMATNPSDSTQKLIDKAVILHRSPEALATLMDIHKWLNNPKGLAGVQWANALFGQKAPTFDLDAFNRKVESWMTSTKYGDMMKDVVTRIFRIAGDWSRDYVAYKANNQILDFNDLEQHFLTLLTDSKYSVVRDEIRDTYRLLMVDEFQDSNPVQIQIFDKLSDLVADGGGETFWVGDPKQSIYGFRGSDTELIMDITSSFVPETINPAASLLKKKPLDTSWRSRPELVDASNDIFSKAFAGELSPADVILPNKARPYGELQAPYMLHWDSANSWQSKTGSPADLAQKICDILYVNRWDVIRKKRDDESPEAYDASKVAKIEPRNVAVLCRYRSDVKSVVSAFREAGLPVSATEPDIIDWAEVQLVLALLRFVVDNDDMGARADIVHLLEETPVETILEERRKYLNSRPDVDEWLSNEDLFKILKKISARIAGLSVSDILSQIILELGLYEFCQKWDYADARRQNLGLLQRLAAQYEDHCVQLGLSSSIVGFVNYICTLDSEIKNEDNTSNTVKVMTYHKAKGLEWNVVCLYNLNNEVSDEDAIAKKGYSGVLTSFNASNVRYINLFPNVFGKKDSLPGPLMDTIRASHLFNECQADAVSEERRLLYVGFTRARDYLVSFSKKDTEMMWISQCGAGDGKAPKPWHSGDVVYEDISGFVSMPARASSATGASTWAVRDEVTLIPKYVNPSKATADMSRVRLTEVFKGKVMAQAIWEDDRCGTCIHNIFAAYDPAAPASVNEAMAKRLIDGAGLSSQLPDAASVVDSAAQFFNFMSMTYPGEDLSMREVPFMLQLTKAQADAIGQTAGQVVRGEMDMVWVRDSVKKSCVLVDYKSYHGNTDIVSPDPNVQKHYSGYAPQLLAYKTALEASGYSVEAVLIYYHVQGRVVKFELL